MSIDLRCDTVTLPTAEMRRAMAEAEVGDDVYGEDPTVNRLEARTADPGLRGRALRALGHDGQRDRDPHPDRARRRGAGRAPQPRGALRAVGHERPLRRDAADGRGPGRAPHPPTSAPRRPRGPTTSDVGLVALENTHNLGGGTVQGVDEVQAVVAAAREAGLRVHVDGARLWNASVALGVSAAALVRGVDTVMVCLSKGLCAPVGSLVVASRERIEEASGRASSSGAA